jgi:hypothetical protein
MSKWMKWAVGGLALALVSSGADAAIMTFNINANGIKEVNAGGTPNGDPDGTGVGTLTLDSGTGGTTGSATFNITFANVDFPIGGYHVHKGPPTSTGGIFLDFAALKTAESMRTGDVLAGTVTGLDSAKVDSVLAAPTDYYLNFHNTPFPGGFVRDQLPEPGSLAFLGLGGLALLGRRRRA